MPPDKAKVVCHLSSLHYRKDLRILMRECRTLSRAGYEVHYVVADGAGDEIVDGVHIHDVGQRRGFPWRFVRTHAALKAKALELQAELYHFHDPELMWMGLQLKRRGYRVVADVHEDVPNEFYGSPDKSWLRRIISYHLLDQIEQFVFPRLDAVITSSPIVEERLRTATQRILNIGCFPNLQEEFQRYEPTLKQAYELVYAGSIAPRRGIIETVKLLPDTNWRYALLGDFQGEGTEALLKGLPAWSTHVDYRGFTLDRQAVVKLLRQSKIGLATLLPHPSYATAYCLKIFEYMAVGIPVIATNFPFWTALIDECQCGLTVDSTDPEAIKTAIQYLLDHPAVAKRYGENGRQAIEEKYNWASQESKLLGLYADLLAEK